MAGEDPTIPQERNDDGNDPFTVKDILNLISIPDFGLTDLSFTQNPIPPSTPNFNINDNNVEFFQQPSSSYDNGYNVGEADTAVLEKNNCYSSMASTIANSPTISQGILLCPYCKHLRGLVHTNGHEIMRLDIQGGIGYVCHAILETRKFGDSIEPRHQTYHLADLKMDGVKKFIEDYCAEREASGYVITQGTNDEFYQAMNACSTINQCRSSISTLPSHHDDVLSSVPLHVGPRDEASVISKARQRKQTPLAAQRERVANLTLKDMSMYFHLPLTEAARRLRLCVTVVKSICRKGGLNRWPYRKMKCLHKNIDSMKSMLRSTTDVEAKAHARQEIEKLKKMMKVIFNV